MRDNFAWLKQCHEMGPEEFLASYQCLRDHLFADELERALELRNRLLKANMRLVMSIAARWSDRRGLDLDDIVSFGFFGLSEALNNFNPEKSAFSTYATRGIELAIKKGVRDEALNQPYRITQSAHDVMGKIQIIRQAFILQKGRDPEQKELWELCQTHPVWGKDLKQVTRERLEEHLEIGSRFRQPGIQDLGSGRYVDVTDLLASEEESVEDQLLNFEQELLTEQALKRALQGLTPSEREVIQMRYGLETEIECTLQFIGDQRGVTRERVRQIEKKALQNLRQAMGV